MVPVKGQEKTLGWAVSEHSWNRKPEQGIIVAAALCSSQGTATVTGQTQAPAPGSVWRWGFLNTAVGDSQ